MFEIEAEIEPASACVHHFPFDMKFDYIFQFFAFESTITKNLQFRSFVSNLRSRSYFIGAEFDDFSCCICSYLSIICECSAFIYQFVVSSWMAFRKICTKYWEQQTVENRNWIEWNSKRSKIDRNQKMHRTMGILAKLFIWHVQNIGNSAYARARAVSTIETMNHRQYILKHCTHGQ